MILKGLVIFLFAILKWYGIGLGLGKLNLVIRFSFMIFTLAPSSIKTSSTMFFLTCTWIIVIWLFTSIVVVFTLECVSTTMATLGSNITLLAI